MCTTKWQAGENLELRTLFYRLARLYRLPVAVIVVFESDNGPSVKRGVQVKHNRHWLEAPFKVLVQAFGFSSHSVRLFAPFADVLFSHFAPQGPREAEAELAYMNRSGLVDVILTDDVDSFAFGAINVIQK
jgi:Holliday junction resolvase YEN1